MVTDLWPDFAASMPAACAIVARDAHLRKTSRSTARGSSEDDGLLDSSSNSRRFPLKGLQRRRRVSRDRHREKGPRVRRCKRGGGGRLTGANECAIVGRARTTPVRSAIDAFKVNTPPHLVPRLQSSCISPVSLEVLFGIKDGCSGCDKSYGAVEVGVK
jgi:hypothetical protein